MDYCFCQYCGKKFYDRSLRYDHEHKDHPCKPCPRCNGYGYLDTSYRDGRFYFNDPHECPRCQGSGRIRV